MVLKKCAQKDFRVRPVVFHRNMCPDIKYSYSIIPFSLRIYCFLSTLGERLINVLDQVVQMIKFVKVVFVKSRLFWSFPSIWIHNTGDCFYTMRWDGRKGENTDPCTRTTTRNSCVFWKNENNYIFVISFGANFGLPGYSIWLIYFNSSIFWMQHARKRRKYSHIHWPN